MPNFVALVDRDPDRRRAFLSASKAAVRVFDGLVTGEAARGDFVLAWAHAPSAPFSIAADDAGVAAVWGDAIPGPAPRRLDARGVRDAWAAVDGDVAAFDGYHAALSYTPAGGLVAGVDILGMFPMYYFAFDGGVLAGTSLSLFKSHPAFRLRPNPTGLAGYFLFGYPVLGETVARDVKRLAAGYALVVPPQQPPHEAPQFHWPPSQTYFDHSYRSQLRLLDETLADAAERHVPQGTPHGIMLSGGLDSRLICGLLRRGGRMPESAVTFGAPGDGDMIAGTRLAKHLRLRHTTADIPLDTMARYAPVCAGVENLSGAFSVMSWGFGEGLRRLPDRVVCGYVGDIILRGGNPAWARNAEAGEDTFEADCAFHRHEGIAPEVLATLLRPDVFGGAVHDVMDRLRRAYETWAELPSQRAWTFGVQVMARLSLGCNLWRIAFDRWPVVPTIDRRVIACVGGMPQATLADRRAHIDLVRTRFPDLAALPIAGSWPGLDPLAPSVRWRLTAAIAGRAMRALAPLGLRGRTAEMFYQRLYDFNGVRWRRARRDIEHARARVRPYLQPGAFDAVVPGPEEELRVENRLRGSAPARLLTGFVYWLEAHDL